VTVYLQGVPEEAARLDHSSPTILFALLQHERKVTVLNFTIQRNTEYEGSVRSKVCSVPSLKRRNADAFQDPLILCVGPRRLHINPVYSQHTRGGGKGSNNVHKFERFLRHGVTSVATTYGPVVFGKQPCVLLRATSDKEGRHHTSHLVCGS
jgi:pre-rRNA-processing protein TSR1